MTVKLTIDIRAVIVGMVFVLVVAGIVTPVAISLAEGNEPPSATNTPQAIVGNAFTYQGRLEQNGFPANGSFDLRFRVYEDIDGNTQVPLTSALLKDDVAVVNGMFSIDLDFGPTVFNGQARHLETGVRPG